MKTLISSLPDRAITSAARAYIFDEREGEGNELPVLQITVPPTKPYTAIATNKNWELYKYNNAGESILLNR